jgi:flagellar basal body rod protein FlgB
MPLLDISSLPVMQVTPLALDAASLRQMIIAANIANSSDPSYLSRRVDFESRLTALLEQAGGIVNPENVRPQVTTDSIPVSLDQELAAQTANNIHYQALIKTLNSQLELLSSAINDGRR